MPYLGDSLGPCLTQLKYCLRLFQWPILMGHQAGGSKPWGTLSLLLSCLRLILMVAGLRLQHGLSHSPPGLVQRATKHKFLCSSYQVARASHRQRLTLICTRDPPERRGPRTNTPGVWLQITTEHHPISTENGTPKGWCCQVPEPNGVNPTL